MISIKIQPRVNIQSLDICDKLNKQLEMDSQFKDSFFVAGVAIQLYNLNVIPRICEMDPKLIACWWRLFDSGFRTENPGYQRKLFMRDEDVTNELFDQFIFWYVKYLSPDFFSKLKTKSLAV